MHKKKQEMNILITTRILVPDYLKEYLECKYLGSPVRFPSDADIYHLIYDLLQKRPGNLVDQGNLEIVLPHRSRGKSPLTYNYISEAGVRMLRKQFSIEFNADLHYFVREQYHTHGRQYIDAIHLFMCRYEIESITPDGLWKNYYRWKKKQKAQKT